MSKTTRSHQSPHSRGGYISPISVVDSCLSLRYRLEDCAGGTKVVRPINEGISFSLNACFLILTADWSASLWYCVCVFLFFSWSVLWKGVGGEWWTLWPWQRSELLADVHGICARILLCSPFTAKNPQISLRGLIQICTLNFSTHNSITEIWRLSTHKVSLDYLQYLGGWSTCVISAETGRGFCIPRAGWRFYRITELCSVQLTFEVVKADVRICLFSANWHLHVLFFLHGLKGHRVFQTWRSGRSKLNLRDWKIISNLVKKQMPHKIKFITSFSHVFSEIQEISFDFLGLKTLKWDNWSCSQFIDMQAETQANKVALRPRYRQIFKVLLLT